MRRAVILSSLFAVLLAPLALAADDTPNAAETRKKLTKKITVEWKNAPFKEIVDDFKDTTGVNIILDTKGGISQNRKFSYKAKDKPASDVLSELLGDAAWGWFVVSKKGDAYDGTIRIRVSDERGTEKESSK